MPTEPEKTWIAAWKLAGPNLQEIQDEELRQRSNKGVRSVAGYTVFEPAPHLNGMVTMQAWLQRFQILLNLKAENPTGSQNEAGDPVG